MCIKTVEVGNNKKIDKNKIKTTGLCIKPVVLLFYRHRLKCIILTDNLSIYQTIYQNF